MTKTRDLADLGGGFIQAGTGAVQRTVESKLQDVVSVKDFGADPTGASDSTSAIQNAINSLGAGGGTVLFPPGDYRVSSIDLSGKLYICLEGTGGRTQSSIRWTSTTGNVVDLTSARFITIRRLNFLPAAQKTAGSVFYLPASASDISFEHVRVSSGYIGFDCDATNVFFNHIDLLDYSTWAWSYGIRIGTSAQAASIHINEFTIASSTSFLNQAIWINNVDTFIARELNVQKQGTAVMTGVYITGGEFIQFHQCHMECGSASADGFLIAGGNNINLFDCHVTSSLHGVRITNGTGVEIIGGRLYYNGRNGAKLEGGKHVTISNVIFADNSTASSGSWDSIFVSANVSDFKLVGNTVGSVRGTPVNCRYGVYISDGTSDRYVVANNTITDFATGALYVGGTGVNKVVSENTNSTENKPLCHATLTTNDATTTTLWSTGLSDERSYYIVATIIAQDSATDNVAAYKRTCLAYRNGGAATIQGQTSVDTIESNAALDCVFDTSVNSLRLRVTGLAGTTFRWRGRIEVYETTALV